MTTQLTNTEKRRRDAMLLAIARERMLMKDLTTTKSGADFHETAVWCVKDALEAAYAAGMEAGENRHAAATNALMVLMLDPKISAWLRANDPKALDQATTAISAKCR